MKRIIFLLFSSTSLLGQAVISGKIINSKTKEPIPFATVGLVKENIGTNALEDGTFQLVSSISKLNDTLIFSCIGFKSLKKSINEFKELDNVVEMTEQETILSEVIVSNKRNWMFEKLNDFSDCGNSFITSNGYQTQLAQHLHVSKANTLLTEIKICRLSNGIFDHEKTIFRIRVYDVDTLNNSPSQDLYDKVIEVKTKDKIVIVNLENYKIRIPQKDFFVAIEWLKIPYNMHRSIRKTNGKQIEHITYRPSIGLTENGISKMETWSLDYKNNWRPMFNMNNKTNISISAVVKY